MFFGSSITSMVATLLAVLMAITFHETAHGFCGLQIGRSYRQKSGPVDVKSVGSFRSDRRSVDVGGWFWLGETGAGQSFLF